MWFHGTSQKTNQKEQLSILDSTFPPTPLHFAVMQAIDFDVRSQPAMPLSTSDYDFRATTSDSLLDLSALTLDSAPSTPLPDFSVLTLDSAPSTPPQPPPKWVNEGHVHMLWDILLLDPELVQRHIDSSHGQLHLNFCWRWATRPCETQLTPLTYLVDQGPRNRDRPTLKYCSHGALADHQRRRPASARCTRLECARNTGTNQIQCV